MEVAARRANELPVVVLKHLEQVAVLHDCVRLNQRRVIVEMVTHLLSISSRGSALLSDAGLARICGGCGIMAENSVMEAFG
jgi:NADH pyrophosphatase NudC (nudix superfamily)